MFDWEIRISDFEIEREFRKPPKTNFTSEKSVGHFMVLPFTFRLGNPKRIVLVNSGLLFANNECVCKTAVLKNCLSIPLSDFPKKTRKKGDLRMDISALKSVSDFAFDCESEIRSLKSKSRFPNRTHPFNLYRDYSKSLTLSNLSEPPLS